jgi:hypothetical protein
MYDIPIVWGVNIAEILITGGLSNNQSINVLGKFE